MWDPRCKDKEALEICTLNHLVRVERITEQTKEIKLTVSLNKIEASGVSGWEADISPRVARGSCAVSDEAVKGGSMLSYALDS